MVPKAAPSPATPRRRMERLSMLRATFIIQPDGQHSLTERRTYTLYSRKISCFELEYKERAATSAAMGTKIEVQSGAISHVEGVSVQLPR
jgi:hypothetical protein